MKKLIVVFFVLQAVIFFGGESPSLFSAEPEERKSSFLDNDELAKALAELGDDTPTVLPSKEPAAVSSVVVEENIKSPIEKTVAEAAEEDAVLFGGTRSNYTLIRHLPEATVQIMEMESEKQTAGNWDKDAFTFAGFDGTEIRAKKVTFPSEKKAVLSVRLLPKHVYRIQFNQVPVFSTINLEYCLQEPTGSKLLNYMFLKVFIGKFEIKRLQVSSKDSWLKTSLSSGAVSFLNQDLPVSFEFSTNQASGLTFSFIPETQ